MKDERHKTNNLKNQIMAAKNNVVLSTFYKCKDGKFITFVNKETEGARQLPPNKNGKIYSYLPYTNLVSNLVGLSIETQEYEGNQWEVLNVKLNDGKDREILQVNIESNEAVNIISRLSNLEAYDINKTIEVGIMLNEDKFNFVYIRQNGQSIKSIFSQENPLPKWKEIKVKGKKSLWDKTEQTEVLKIWVAKINDVLKVETTQDTKNPLTNVDDLNGYEIDPETGF
jgi:hypothetical protein